MKRTLLLAGVALALVVPAQASAHPLGNFTTNHYSRVVASGDRVYVLYVLDLAEIPTFQQKAQRAKGAAVYVRRTVGAVARGLSLTINGTPVPLRPLRDAIGFPPGVAGLRTTRLEVVFATPELGERSGTRRLDYRDGTFPNRIGWKEIVVQADAGARIDAASVPAKSISDELRAYPKDLLQSPRDVRSATATFDPGAEPARPPALSSTNVLDKRVTVRAGGDGGFAGLIAKRDVGIGFVLVSLVIAFFWGAAHAFSPGHGKSVIAAYLVGSRGTPRHAVLLGIVVTVTHTIGVFALGLVTLSLSQFILPEQLYPWLNLVSALLIVAVGVSVLRWRLREWRGVRSHNHDHNHDHPHVHATPAMGLRQILGVGISGGIIPCPTALVVLLAAISLHRVGYGLVLILAFSVGLATAMTGIGLLAVTAKRVFTRVDFESGFVRLLPAVSAVVVLVLGLAMTVRALPKLT
jgi:nickel/cobalt exporter